MLSVLWVDAQWIPHSLGWRSGSVMDATATRRVVSLFCKCKHPHRSIWHTRNVATRQTRVLRNHSPQQCRCAHFAQIYINIYIDFCCYYIGRCIYLWYIVCIFKYVSLLYIIIMIVLVYWIIYGCSKVNSVKKFQCVACILLSIFVLNVPNHIRLLRGELR